VHRQVDAEPLLRAFDKSLAERDSDVGDGENFAGANDWSHGEDAECFAPISTPTDGLATLIMVIAKTNRLEVDRSLTVCLMALFPAGSWTLVECKVSFIASQFWFKLLNI